MAIVLGRLQITSQSSCTAHQEREPTLPLFTSSQIQHVSRVHRVCWFHLILRLSHIPRLARLSHLPQLSYLSLCASHPSHQPCLSDFCHHVTKSTITTASSRMLRLFVSDLAYLSFDVAIAVKTWLPAQTTRSNHLYSSSARSQLSMCYWHSSNYVSALSEEVVVSRSYASPTLWWNGSRSPSACSQF